MDKHRLVFVVIGVFFLVSAFALVASLSGEVPRKSESKYEDLGVAVRLASTNWAESKIAPQRPYDFHPVASPGALLFEDFEGGVVPPSGWTEIIRNIVENWDTLHYTFEGNYGARVYYDETYSDTQDEWLVSPALDLTTCGDTCHVYFYWIMSYYWSVDPYDNYDLELWISTDGGANFTTKLWQADVDTFTSWVWYRADIDLDAYLTETNVKLAWRYYGYDGAQASIDFVTIGPPPEGRCCYGDPQAPSCADVTEDSCTVLGGEWNEMLNCTDDPCPIIGVGDNCLNPILVNLPAALPYSDLNQTTCGRGNDYDGTTCLGYYDGGEDIIYELNVSSAINVDINLEPKATSWTGICIDDQCPPGGTCIDYSTAASGPHSMMGVHLEPGTYYIMVDTWPSPDCIPDFDLTITESAPPPDNDECTGAPVITSFPSTVYGTTIGATVDCPGLLDWNAVWYKFELPYGYNDVHIDFCPTDDNINTVGVILYDECPPNCPDYILRTCYQWVNCVSGYDNPTIWWDKLPGGDYWFPVYVVNSSGDPIDFGFTVTVTEWAPHYCEAWGNIADEYIERVQVGTIDNSSGWEGYGDFTALSTDIVKGTGYPITITLANSYSSDVGALWVDWNQDSDFEDLGEEITLTDSPGYGPYTATLNAPGGAPLGSTRMRIRLQYGGTPIPCCFTSWGEVEDYTLNVRLPNDPPACSVNPPGPFTIFEGETLSFVVTGTDPNAGDIITITGSGIPAGATMTPSLPATGATPRSSSFDWTTGPGDAGLYALTFIVQDDEQLACTCNVQITVYPNEPPACDITPSGPFSVYEGLTVNFQVTGTDPDAGDVVSITGTGIPAGASLTPTLPVSGSSPQTSSFFWTTGVGDIGNYTVSFVISDNHGLSVVCQAEIEVTEKPAVSSVTRLGLILLVLFVAGFFGYMIIRKRRISPVK